jgi:peptidoglycan-N-acetylglucosamine deacetylase
MPTSPGPIILEHDGAGNRSQTVAALRIVLPRLLAEGYYFLTP